MDSERDEAATINPLIVGGLLAPVSKRSDAAQLWMDCDLCSMIENRFHRALHPRDLTARRRGRLRRRALAEGEYIHDPRKDDYSRSFWLIRGRRRVGTISISTSFGMAMYLGLSSLYVFPEYRGLGIAERVLRGAYGAAVAAGHRGIRIGTHWTWQRPLRFYATRLKMWAFSFKRSIDFVWDKSWPDPTTEIGTARAGFSAEGVELITTHRAGERLRWSESDAMTHSALAFHARSTFAVQLALAGWPLVTSLREFERSRGWDIGGADLLAYKIGIFEHLDRRAGFDVRTPKIPGLPYAKIARRLGHS